MLKKQLMTFFIFSFTSLTYAETCPSISELHNQNLHGWSAFDISNGTPLSNDRREAYYLSVQYLTLVEWIKDAPEGSGFCYYAGSPKDDMYLDAYLAKPNLTPDHWDGVEHTGEMQCNPDTHPCLFMEQ